MRDALLNHPETRTEVFGPNSWYGSSRCLRNYSYWNLPLPFILPHGVSLSSSFVWQAEIESGLKKVYSFPKHRAIAYEEGGAIKPIKGASPWLYLLRSRNFKKPKIIGRLAFPAHSTHHVEVKTDDEAYACFLGDLKKRGESVAVCMYWRDIQLGRHSVFLRKGLKVLSAGHIYDELFFERLLHILRHTKRVHSPSVGSHLFYAAAAGCHVTHAEQYEKQHSAPDNVSSRDISRANPDVLRLIRKMFNEGTSPDEQNQFAEDFLGKTNMKSPAGLFATIACSAMCCRLWRQSAFTNHVRYKRCAGLSNSSAAPFHVNSDGSVFLQALS